MKRPRIVPKGPLGCQIWQGATSPRGYPVMVIAGRQVQVRRVYYERFKGPIPAGCRIVMDCGERLCLEPAHMVAR